MKLAVIRCRDFENTIMLNEILLKHKHEIMLIISGASKGADAMEEG
jgi:hypothetical protein